MRAVEKSLILGVDASLMDRTGKGNNAVFGYTLYRRFAEILAERLRALTLDNSRLRKELAISKSIRSA